MANIRVVDEYSDSQSSVLDLQCLGCGSTGSVDNRFSKHRFTSKHSLCRGASAHKSG